MYPSEGKKPRPMGRLLPTLPRPAHEGPDLSAHKLGEPLNIAHFDPKRPSAYALGLFLVERCAIEASHCFYVTLAPNGTGGREFKSRRPDQRKTTHLFAVLGFARLAHL